MDVSMQFPYHDAEQATYIFADNLIEASLEDPPREDLDVLLDVARTRMRETHDQPEEFLLSGLGFCNGLGFEALEVTTNAVLLVDSESIADDSLKQVDDVHRGDVALITAAISNAADDNARLNVVVLLNWLERERYVGALLLAIELDQPATRINFVFIPMGRKIH